MTGNASPIIEPYREVGTKDIPAGEARTVLMRRSYDFPIEDVWEACTDPDRLNRWFLKVTGDLRAGGTFSLEGVATGDILRCEPPRLLKVTWAYGDRPVDEVELRLSPGVDGDTVLELEHATVSKLVEWEGELLDVIPGMGSGWEPVLYALDLHLLGKLPDAAAAEWQSGNPPPEVDELTNRSAQAWAALVEAEGTASNDETSSIEERP